MSQKPVSPSPVSPSEQTIRVFVAAPIPQPAKLVLSKVIESLAGKIPVGVRWVNPDGIHLTIKFLGDIAPAGVAGITEAMSRAAAQVSRFQIRLWGLGTFPNATSPNQRRPRVLWVGVEGDLARLRELQEITENELASLGYTRDRRPFNPHLTLGRVRDRVSEQTRRGIGPAVSSEELEGSEPWLVESVELIQSNLGPGGATYSTLANVSLKGVED